MKSLRRIGASLRNAIADRWPYSWLRLGHPTGDRLGQLGETVVARDLARRGWTILARRCSTPFGELDVVALLDSTLVAVEVKTGRVPEGTPRWTPGERLDPTTLERQRRAAAWLARRTTGAWTSRVDLVEVRLVGARSRLELHHQTDVRARKDAPHQERRSGAWVGPSNPSPDRRDPNPARRAGPASHSAQAVRDPK